MTTTPEREALAHGAKIPDLGPWAASADGRCVSSDDFEHDVLLRVSGDFACDADRIAYAQDIARRLAASPAAGGVQPPYPEGIINGPCVCGSWPGGECLRCEWRPATPPAAPAQPPHTEAPAAQDEREAVAERVLRVLDDADYPREDLSLDDVRLLALLAARAPQTAVSGAVDPVGQPAGEQTGPVSAVPTPQAAPAPQPTVQAEKGGAA